MRIMVFDLPASESGALAILKDFYHFICVREPDGDQWSFVVSTDQLGVAPKENGVSIIRRPEVKSSWVSRIRFELFESGRLAKNWKADIILSLQNIIILNTRIPQVVYVHQSLPYIGKRFSYFKKDERFLAIYADIFRILIGFSVKRALAVVVQTFWFKDEIVKKHKIPEEKILVIPPSVDITISKRNIEIEPDSFFYPATPFIYKNIEVIVNAVSALKIEGVSPKIIITITGDENNYIRHLSDNIEKDGLKENFVFCGRISRDEVFNYYRSCTLLFPSRLESFGLPLLEARLSEAYIIASETPFAREILDGYKSVEYFEVDDSKVLANIMKRVMKERSLAEKINCYTDTRVKTEVRWKELVDLVVQSSIQNVTKNMYLDYKD